MPNNIGGKDVPTFTELLKKAHQQGLVSIKTNLIKTELVGKTDKLDAFYWFFFKAFVTMSSPSDSEVLLEFEATGDANKYNVGNMIKPHILRMAETRAVARALRFALGEDTVFEEFD
tara:strand:+ start:203 stop:553 length:351 start_codon:yes stop_codon:yes gene_type:complete